MRLDAFIGVLVGVITQKKVAKRFQLNSLRRLVDFWELPAARLWCVSCRNSDWYRSPHDGVEVAFDFGDFFMLDSFRDKMYEINYREWFNSHPSYNEVLWSAWSACCFVLGVGIISLYYFIVSVRVNSAFGCNTK